jgi:phosphohistidine phosphatase SixA
VTGRVVLVALLLALAGCGEKDEPSATAQPPANPLVQQLREGGNTLVIRHAIADAEINRQELLKSCTFQRNLTEAGREQARTIGRGVKALDVPVGEVRASPMCRARDTAKLAFGRVTNDRRLLSPGVIGSEADDRRRAAALKKLVAEPPPKGENTVLVTHTGNIGAALGEETVQEGETLVYGAGGKLVGRVRAEEWATLATD